MRSTEPDQPADPSEFPPELQEALRRMSQRGPVRDLTTGDVVARDGRLTGDEREEQLVACLECARAIALGWFGAVARHLGEPNSPVCVLCGEGAATLTPEQWFARIATLAANATHSGQRRTWRDDAVKGLGATMMTEPPQA